MAVEKEIVIARFRTGKFKNVPITNQRLDAIATKLSSKLPDDADEATIDSELDDLNDLLPGGFMEVHKTDQRADNEKKKQKEAAKADPNQQQQGQNQDTEQSELSKLIAAAVSQAVGPIAQKVSFLEAEKQQATLKEKAKAALKDVPEVFWKRAPLPEKEEDLETWAEEIKNDYTALKQVEVNSNLGTGATARGTVGGTNNAAKSEMEKFVQEKIAQEKVK